MRSLAGIAVLALAGAVYPAAAESSFVLRNATVHTVSGADIANAAVLVTDGKIAEVGARVTAPKGARVIDLKGLHVYPGMIDSATELGLTEIGSVRETNDTTEIGNFKPQLRAAVAVNPTSEHIPVTRANGITSAVTLPAGGIVAGQASLMHLDGWTSQEMAYKPSVAMRIEFPAMQSGGRRFSSEESTPSLMRTPYTELKRRYEQQLRELDGFFEEARRYQKAKAANRPDFRTDLKFEAMLPVLAGKLPVMIRADKEKSIMEAIRWADKQKVRMILQQGRDAWKVAPELKSRNIPVILPATLALPEQEDDPYDKPFTTPGELFRAGVKIAFSTGGPSAGGGNPRNLPFEAAAAVGFGLPVEEALKAVTLYAAQIWGAGDEIGSIEPGKWADLIVTDGDPLDARTQVKQMFIQGKPVDLDNKHHRLYEKYINRP